MARKYKSRVSTDKLDAKIEQQKEALEKAKARYEAEKEALEVERFSIESTLGEIMNQPLAVEIFQNYSPEMLENPLIKFAYSMTLSELMAQAPESKPLYDMVITQLNELEV